MEAFRTCDWRVSHKAGAGNSESAFWDMEHYILLWGLPGAQTPSANLEWTFFSPSALYSPTRAIN